MSLTTYFYDPFNFDNSFFLEFDRLFDAAFDARTSGTSNRQVVQHNTNLSLLRPRMDLHESQDKRELTATFELPGMKKEDVTIDVHYNRLTISGESSLAKELEKDGHAVRERKYGKFYRTLPLPAGTRPEQVRAKMENGVLTVKFPKTSPEQGAMRITIN